MKAVFALASSVNGVEREPGATHTCVTPKRLNSSSNTRDQRRFNKA
ncbi:Uncharacterised protein [Vibrio cholerae]|nr:Uncharacterised protein [Vibrio cholerae]CSI78762.1 Uncharacterised protein [Vibrio cholerae]